MRRIRNNIKNHSNWIQYYTNKYFSSKVKDFTFKCRGGLEIKVPKRMMQTYKECFFDETYFKGLPKRITKHSIKTVIDIGANVGYFSFFMFSQFPKTKVLAFEPMPNNFKLLNTYKNDNPGLDFTVINQAVSKSDQGSITLNYDASDSYTTDASVFENNSTKDSIKVKTTSLEEIIKDNNLNNIDFLKLDCEGSEYDILYGASTSILDKISTISIETHQGKADNENTGALIKYLKKVGFEINFKNDIIWAWKIPINKEE